MIKSTIYRTAREVSTKLVNIGAALAEKKLLDEAAAIFLLAIKLNPKDVGAYTNLGHVYHDKGMFAEAEKEYEQAIKLRPDAEDAYELLGTLYSEKGDLSKAVNCYEKASKLNTSDPVLHVNIGQLFFEKGILNKARIHLEKAIALNTQNANAHNTLGAISSKQGKSEEAIGQFKEAIRLDPKKWIYHNNLGDEYFDRESWSKAIESYQKVVSLVPDSAAAHNNLGCTYANDQQLDQAIEEFKLAIHLDSNLKAAQENLDLTREKANLSKTATNKTSAPKLCLIKEAESENYADITLFENELRIFIGNSMEKVFGKDWWIRQVPTEIQQTCSEKKKADEEKRWENTEKLDLMCYADFSDYATMMEKRDNWRQVFSICFPSKEGIIVKLRELIPIRNDVMHGRKLSAHDRAKLKLYITEIFSYIRKKQRANT